MSGLLGDESATYARGVPRAAWRFVRRYSYELRYCNRVNTARRSRAAARWRWSDGGPGSDAARVTTAWGGVP